MPRLFDQDLLDTHDLYHARYGRGAVIVAVRRDTGEEPDQKRISEHRHAAHVYNAREPGSHSSAPAFHPVLSVREEAGFARLKVQFEEPARTSAYTSPTATIERVIPLEQITLEIVVDAQMPVHRPNRR